MSAQNGNAAATNLAAAIKSEREIADEAQKIRDDHGDEPGLDAKLYLKLEPLLRRPIPPGFITKVGVVTGKPYASTGVKSVQVQYDRMDAVLTPLGWRISRTFDKDGKLCTATVRIIDREGNVLVERDADGGVDRGSTVGNVYKGSFTNAAKLALARTGPGHEVYIGAADFDPDTDEDAAKEQGRASAQSSPAATLPPHVDEIVTLSKELIELWGGKEELKAQLVAAGATDTTSVATAAASMAPEQAAEFIAEAYSALANAEAQAAA